MLCVRQVFGGSCKSFVIPVLFLMRRSKLMACQTQSQLKPAMSTDPGVKAEHRPKSNS